MKHHDEHLQADRDPIDEDEERPKDYRNGERSLGVGVVREEGEEAALLLDLGVKGVSGERTFKYDR